MWVRFKLQRVRPWALLNMPIRTTALSVFLLLFLASCDGYTHIKGKITDTSGRPIQGAQVRMKTISGGGDDNETTDADGFFSVAFTHAPYNVDLLLMVTKEGYKPVEKRFKSADAKQFPPTIALEAVSSVAIRISFAASSINCSTGKAG